MVTQENKDALHSFETSTNMVPVVDEEMHFNNGSISCSKQKGYVRKKVCVF